MKYSKNLAKILFSIFIGLSYGKAQIYEPLKLNSVIEIDGNPYDKAWQKCDSMTNFKQCFPYDTGLSRSKTVAKIAIDDKYIYILGICYDSLQDRQYVAESMKRDFSYPRTDAFAFYLDPFDDETNGFSFAVNPFGAQREGLIEGSGIFGVSTAWDNIWFSACKQYKGFWVAEMKIPFKSIRFKQNVNYWKFNISRNNLKINENSAWVRVPRNLNIASLSYLGTLKLNEAPQKKGQNIALIPYAVNNYQRNFLDDSKSNKPNIGFDGKITLGNSLNLDITANPDFSNVEVDVEQINLTRFNLFFPERRFFFLENSDLFASFGFRQIRPFFSRRIGLHSNGQNVPIIGGMRLSGKINKDWRIGAMEMITDGISNVTKGQTYSVAAVQRQIEESNIAAIFVNRNPLDGFSLIKKDFSRVVGVDYNIRAFKQKVQGKLFYHQSFSSLGTDAAHASWLMYTTQKWFAMWNHEYVGKKYDADVGFTPRIFLYNPNTETQERHAYWRLEPEIRRTFFPSKSDALVAVRAGLYHSSYYDSSFQLTESLSIPKIDLEFKNTASASLGFSHRTINLWYEADITRSGNNIFPAGVYRYGEIQASYNSTLQSAIRYSLNATAGNFFMGQRYSVSGSLQLLKRPYLLTEINARNDFYSYNSSDTFTNEMLTLIALKIEITFTPNIYLTTFAQYNGQSEKFSINTRFQWRYRPMSDFFIVFTENYDPRFNTEIRAISAKLVFWLNT